MNISTYRLNRPRGQLVEIYFHLSAWNTRSSKNQFSSGYSDLNHINENVLIFILAWSPRYKSGIQGFGKIYGEGAKDQTIFPQRDVYTGGRVTRMAW